MISQEDVKKQLYTALQELGLSDSEIELYALSLFLGPATIMDIARHLGTQRPNIYKLIQGLERHDLTHFSDRKKYSRLFSVESPAVVLKKLRERKDALSRLDLTIASVMPDLMGFYHQADEQTRLQVLSGEDEYEQAFSQMFEETGGEILFFGSVHEFIGLVSPKTYEYLVRQRIQRKVSLRALFCESQEARTIFARKEELREVRIFSPLIPFATSFQASRHKVIIWQPQAPLAVVIEDEYIVDMLRSMFESLWHCAEYLEKDKSV